MQAGLQLPGTPFTSLPDGCLLCQCEQLGKPKRQVNGRFPARHAPWMAQLQQVCACLVVLSLVYNGVLCFLRGWGIIRRLCAKQTEAGLPGWPGSVLQW